MSTRYFIGITLPANLSAPLDKWRLQYDPKSYNRVPLHITVKSPFYLTEKEENLIQIIEQSAKSHKNIPIQVNGAGSFGYHHDIIFAKVEASDELEHLHRHIVTAVSPLTDHQTSSREHAEFHPHITLANHIRDTAAQDLWQNLVNAKLQLSFITTHLTIFSKQPESPYQIAHRISLDN